MTKKRLSYIVNRTFHEILIGIYILAESILPDLTIFSSFRKVILESITFVKIGKKTRIRKGLFITNIGKLSIGENCFINRGNIFDNKSLIIIGKNCSIGYGNKFITSSHYEKQNVDHNILDFTTYSREITIGNNVWIRSGCTILPGTVIEDNVILAAGSVAIGQLESGFLYGGIPARKIRKTEGFIHKK